MKTFLKFIVSIIVIALIIGTVLFLLTNKEEYNQDNSNYNVEEVIENIQKIEKDNNEAVDIKTFEDNVDVEIMGTKNKAFFESFEIDETTVSIKTSGTMVYIIPNSDFMDNAQYHYDESGNLVLYVCELIGVGGEIRYYYKDENFIKNEFLIEEGISLDTEDVNEILQRSKVIYQKYIK